MNHLDEKLRRPILRSISGQLGYETGEMEMKKECELLKQCAFFKKYQVVKELGFIQLYCRGPKMKECARKKYREKYGTDPPDDLMPGGQIIVTNHPS